MHIPDWLLVPLLVIGAPMLFSAIQHDVRKMIEREVAKEVAKQLRERRGLYADE